MLSIRPYRCGAKTSQQDPITTYVATYVLSTMEMSSMGFLDLDNHNDVTTSITLQPTPAASLHQYLDMHVHLEPQHGLTAGWFPPKNQRAESGASVSPFRFMDTGSYCNT